MNAGSEDCWMNTVLFVSCPQCLEDHSFLMNIFVQCLFSARSASFLPCFCTKRGVQTHTRHIYVFHVEEDDDDDEEEEGKRRRKGGARGKCVIKMGWKRRRWSTATRAYLYTIRGANAAPNAGTVLMSSLNYIWTADLCRRFDSQPAHFGPHCILCPSGAHSASHSPHTGVM